MRKFLATLIVVVVAASTSLLSVGTASAFGGERLACLISPSHSTSPTAGCQTSVPSVGGYSIQYVVRNESGSYTFAWTLPSGARLASGCTSTSDFCTVTVPETQADRDLIATVVLTQGGAHETLSTDAFIPAGCGRQLC